MYSRLADRGRLRGGVLSGECLTTSCTVYGFNFECSNIRFTARLEGNCVIFNTRIQALKLFIYYYIYIGKYLKDVILALSRGARK